MWLALRTFCSWRERWVNTVRTYELPSAFDLTFESVAAMVDALGDHWSIIMRGWISAEARYEGFEWDLVDVDDGLLLRTGESLGAGVGTGGAGILPTQVSGLVQLNPILGAYSRTRGLQYLPFVSPARLDSTGLLTAESLAALQEVADRIAAPVPDALAREWFPVTVSRVTGILTRFRGGVAREGLSSQRRRGGQWPSDPPPIWV